jgi:hypothetical protein
LPATGAGHGKGNPERKNRMRSDERNLLQKHSAGARRIIAILARPRVYLLVLVPVLAAALVVTLLPRGASLADVTPSDDGVTWSPGQVSQANNSNGACYVQVQGNLGTPDINNVANALDDVQAQTVNENDTFNYYIASTYPSSSSSAPMTGSADTECFIVTAFQDGGLRAPASTAASLTALTRPAGPDAQGIPPYAPDGKAYLAAKKWFSGAIADLAATAAYIAVSAVTIGTMIALGATLGPAGELASAALGALAGCIGGAVSTGILLAIGAGSETPLGSVTNAVTGCVTGAALSQIPVHEAGQWLGNQFNAVLGSGALAIGGAALESAASEADDVSLVPVGQAMSDAVAGLEAA